MGKLVISFLFLLASFYNSSFSTASSPAFSSAFYFDTPHIFKKDFLHKLSRAIFQNEARCDKNLLLSWNEKEPFPSLGIGHAIWYPAGVALGYKEGWPEVLEFIKKELAKKKLPKKKTATVTSAESPPPSPDEETPLVWPELFLREPLGPAPWISREEFLASDHKPLLQFLAHPQIMELQTRYMLARMKNSLRSILLLIAKEKGAAKAQAVFKKVQLLLKSEEGTLALIDYVNFKGEGLLPTEITPLGQYPWGLKVVLEKMTEIEPYTTVCFKKDRRHYNEMKCANYTFAEAALWALNRLVHHSGPENSEERKIREKWYQGGWTRRITETYLPGALDRITCDF